MSETHQKFDGTENFDEPNKNEPFAMAASGDEDEHPPILEPEGHDAPIEAGFEPTGPYLVGSTSQQVLILIKNH